MLKTNADHARLWPCYNSKSARERTQTTIAEIRRPRLVAGLRYLRGQTLYNYQIFIGPYGRVVCDSASVCWICYKRNQPNVKHMVNIVRGWFSSVLARPVMAAMFSSLARMEPVREARAATVWPAVATFIRKTSGCVFIIT